LLEVVGNEVPSEARGALAFACGAEDCGAKDWGAKGGGPDNSTIVRAGSDVAAAARGRAGSLFPGGASFEFTAYLPTLTPPWPQPPRSRTSASYVPAHRKYCAQKNGPILNPRARKGFSMHFFAGPPIEFPSSIGQPNPPTLMGNMAKHRN